MSLSGRRRKRYKERERRGKEMRKLVLETVTDNDRYSHP